MILTNAEMLRDPSYSEPERQRFAESILTMSHQMRGLVESLLELARVDNGAVKKVFEALDWSSLVQDAVLPFEALFFEKGLTLQTDIEPGITVRGSAQHLRQCAEILLDNAVKYSAPGTVRVALKKTGHDKCALSVATPGEPLSPEECKNVFKRFYRVDRARAMDHSYGLGLSIAESIVSEHGGKIRCDGKADGNVFTVTLPTVKGEAK